MVSKWMLLGLMASKLPEKTWGFPRSPSGTIKLRFVCEAAKNPIEEHTGARIPKDRAWSFSTPTKANLRIRNHTIYSVFFFRRGTTPF